MQKEKKCFGPELEPNGLPTVKMYCTVGPNSTIWHRTFALTVLYGKSYDTAYTLPYIWCHFGNTA